ncbi:hypothetical protein HPB51_009363 [Rhipicephalus microplus]|uniref:Phospholipase A2-like central domain-containing protein n=1 Tax=Rhipicephalus microplus TaxID=6941 RepID=A0A9J6F0B7_RHIMP|nr:hypothetical protein HPB51_009363 [Rhipicephalus microplus]
MWRIGMIKKSAPELTSVYPPILPCRFRSCLKMANHGASYMVGKLYFNVVQTKCFIFKYREVCELRSWWGQCLQREKKKVAVLRSGMTY